MAADDEDAEVTTGHVCPECGEAFALAMQLGLHRRRAHGVEGKTPKKSRKSSTARPERSSRSESKHTARKRAVQETLTEFVNFTDEVRGRGDTAPGDLADVIRRDAPKIADSLAYAADKFNPIGWFVDTMLGHGGPVTFLRGFLGVGTWMAGHWRQMLADRPEPEAVYPVDEYGVPIESVE